MKKIARVAVALLLALALAAPAWAAQGQRIMLEQAPASIYFSPRGGATQALVEAIGQAKKSIRVQAYSFTSPQIVEALIAAHGRGVDVQVVLDRSQLTAKGSGLEAVARAGIAVYVDSTHAIAHNKVMVLDEKLVFTGSFNFTVGAELRNAENLLGIVSRQLATAYLANWERHREHSAVWEAGK